MLRALQGVRRDQNVWIAWPLVDDRQPGQGVCRYQDKLRALEQELSSREQCIKQEQLDEKESIDIKVKQASGSAAPSQLVLRLSIVHCWLCGRGQARYAYV